MLNDFDKDIADIDLTAENAKELIIAAASKRAEGLSNKNNELLGKLSSNENLSAAEKAKLTELEKFKSNAEITSAKEAEDWQAASALQQKAWNDEKELLSNANTNYKSQLETLLIDNGLSSQLDAIEINPALKAGAVAILKSGATIIDGKAMVGDKSLSDKVTEWAASDAGKAFCLAPNNSGGNANGGNIDASKVADTLEACKGDKTLEAAYFNKKLAG